PPVAQAEADPVGAVAARQRFGVRVEVSGAAFRADVLARSRLLCQDLDDAAHGPRAVQVGAAARNHFDPLDIVRYATPVDPSAESVVERHTIEEHQPASIAEPAQTEELRGGMVVSAAEKAGLHAGHCAQQVVDLG